MYKLVVTATAKNGKTHEAIAFLKGLVEYLNKKYNRKSEAYMQLFGTAGTFYVISEYKDLAGFQEAQAKIMADEGYWALAQKGAELIIDPPTLTLLQPV
jgi:hypothetical protein